LLGPVVALAAAATGGVLAFSGPLVLLLPGPAVYLWLAQWSTGRHLVIRLETIDILAR